MKSAVAWNVKGIRYDARETARQAARRAGMSVGEWLNSVIIEQAGEAARGDFFQRHGAEDLSAVHEQLDALASRLGQMGSQDRRSDAGSGLRGLERWLAGLSKDMARCSEETPQRVSEAIVRLNARLDQLIDSGRNVASEFERRVAAVDQALDEIAGEGPDRGAEDEDWSDALDEIRTRQRALEADLAESDEDTRAARGRSSSSQQRMSALDQQIRALSRQLEMMRRPCSFDDSVADLRSDLGHIGDALAKAMPRRALEALEAEVHSLANRVDRGLKRGGDAAALAAIEQRLDKVHDVLAGLTPAENVGGFEAAVEALSRKIDRLAAGGPDMAGLQHLERAIGELRGITERVASGEALTKLSKEVRTLSERMDQFAGASSTNAVSALERRVEELSKAINARAAAGGDAVPARLEALFGALTAQLDRLELGAHDQPALAHVAEHIAKLAEKIDASDARVGNVEMIERGLADVFLQIEEARANAIEADEFKRDLADLRLSQTEADRRTQHTLEAVQETIERLTDRLASIETVGRSGPAPGASGSPSAVPPPPASALPIPQTSAPAGARTAPPVAHIPVLPPEPATAPPERVQTKPSLGQGRAPIEPDLPADHPLEPGFAPARGRPTTPSERIAASEAMLGPAKPASPPEPSEKANFIAAARRAAQAAAAEVAQSGDKSDDGTGDATGEAGEKFGKLKRPLFMSVAAGILILGGTHITLSVLGSSGGRLDPPRQAVAEVTPPVTTVAAQPPAKVNAATAPSAPVPDSQLLAPTRVATTKAVSAGDAPPVPAAPARQDSTPSAAPSQWGMAALNPPAPEVTGSVPNSAAEPQGAAPAADSLPAAIGGPGLRAAAVSGNAAAEYEIAVRYAEGRGVQQSFGDAARWLERAANQGVAPAQYRLGSLYEKGHGVKKDLEAARRLYIKAAEKGSAKAMHNLAVLYAEGIDGKPDYQTASQWFRKAAGHGVADSQYNLGILYARGIGVEQILAESYKWFALAAQQGDQDSARKRDDVGARLDSQSLVAAKLAAQTFTVAPQPEEAIAVKPPAGGWEHPAAASAPAPAKKPASRRIGST